MASPDKLPPVICILGPTCAWKSEVALRLAEELDGEVISCDSMQVYQGLEIGTAQPQRHAGVPQHLIGCWDIRQPYDANRFVQHAERIISEIDARNRRTVLVGGTGLYARALVYGLTLLPSDLSLSLRLRERMRDPQECRRMLADIQADCESRGLAMPPEVSQNPRRLLRSYEVWSLTGHFPWELARRPEAPRPRYRQFCILPDWTLLRGRIRRRTAKMLQDGWIAEALAAETAGLFETVTARQALGYREICDFMACGQPGGQAALAELLANRTIQFARRQLTWFRHQHPGAVMIPVDHEEEAVEQILAEIRRHLAGEAGGHA